MYKHTVVLVLLLVVCSLTGAMAIAAETVKTDYFPLALGNRWVYASSEGSEDAPALESWEVIRQDGKAFVIRIQQPFVTLGGIEERFEVDGEGVKRYVPDTIPPESRLIFKFPPAAGVRWQSGDEIYAITAVAETVTVPAGTFSHCVQVTRWNKATKVTIISTYAPGVGLVQREESFPVIGGLGGGFASPTRGRTVLRLKEWSGKSEKQKIDNQQ